MQTRQISKRIFLFLFLCIIIVSCKKNDSSGLDVSGISTVYWDFSKFTDTLVNMNAPIFIGEVGNNREIDSLHLTITNADSTAQIFYSGTVPNNLLTSEDRKDYSSSKIKWYKINFKSPVAVPAGKNIYFTLQAFTPFGVDQDPTQKITKNVRVQ